MKRILILGTRGIPAAHGGFETFAEFLALYLVEHGWEVTVYCQEGEGNVLWEDEWKGVHRVHIPVHKGGALGTIIFDWKSTWHAAKQQGLVLTLGYNTAIFSFLYRIKGKTNLFNMDGLEWKRDKWSLPERAWLYLNERMGCLLGNHLIADHPEIKNHLVTRVKPEKVTMIPYGANQVNTADISLLDAYGLNGNEYSIVIARPEPENSTLEIVRAFSCKPRGHKLLVLGKFLPENCYHQSILDAASDEVIFPGAIYDKDIVNALRFYARIYIHGHTVGGTNPSLIEAMGAGSAVLAHDNRFNCWVAGDGACFFKDEQACVDKFDDLLNSDEQVVAMKQVSVDRYLSMFTWDAILAQYEILLKKFI